MKWTQPGIYQHRSDLLSFVEYAEPVSDAGGGVSLQKRIISISNSNKLVKIFEAFFKW